MFPKCFKSIVIAINYIILNLLCVTLFSNNQFEFDVMPTNIHFFGTVVSGKNIIAYGSNGVYMMTTDRGKSWKQYSIQKCGDIRKIVNYKDTLWGVMKEGSIVRSVDNGMNWEIFEFHLDNNDFLINMVVCDHSIYLRTLKKIYRLNRSFDVLNFYTNNRLEINEDMGIYRYHPDLPDNFFYYDFIKYYNEELFVSLFVSNTGFLILDKELNESRFISLKDRLITNTIYKQDKVILDTSQYLIDMFTYKGKMIFNFANNLYYPDESYEKWTYLYGDTSFMNWKDQYSVQRAGSCTPYFTKNDELFIGYIHRNDENNSFYDYGIKKYQSTPSNTFVNYHGRYYNKYYTMSLHRLLPNIIDKDALLGVLYNQYPGILEDSVIVKAGWGKSLMQTTNDAKSWELVSFLYGKPKMILNDSTYIFLRDEPNKNDIYYTEDYGVTFKPVKLIQNYKHLWYPSVYYHVNFLFLDSNGNGFLGGSSKYDGYSSSIARTYDKCKSLSFQSLGPYFSGGGIDPYIPWYYPKIFQEDSLFFICKSDSTATIKGIARNTISIYDTAFSDSKSHILDTFNTVDHILANDMAHYYLLCRGQNKETYKFDKVEIKETHDSGRTRKNILTIDKPHYITQTYEHNQDSLFFSCQYPTRIYLFDRNRLKIDTIFKTDKHNKALLMVISGEFFIVGDSLFLRNYDRYDLTKWEPGVWDCGMPSFKEVMFKGNVALARLEDSLRSMNYYRIMQKDKTPLAGVEENTEHKYYTNHFYAYQPYPQPGKDKINVNISWDHTLDIENSIIGIFNSIGERIESADNIALIHKSQFSAKLIWNCHYRSTGIYFIGISHNGIIDCIPVIVER